MKSNRMARAGGSSTIVLLLLLRLGGGAAESGDPLFDAMAELVVPYGYPLDQHFVTTTDGYILRMFRIRHGAPAHAAAAPPPPPPPQPRPPVLLQHGLLGSSSDWALNGANTSLAFALADAGFDVWLGNVRGNRFSRNHTALGPAEAQFWAFSWDAMAARDLPAMVGQVLSTSGAATLAYVGHSQGTTVALAALATQPALAARVSLAVLLAPVAFATHVSSAPLVNMAKLQTDQLFALLGVHEFLPSSELASRLEGELCSVQPHLCVNLLAAIAGYNPDNLDESRLPLYLKHTPSGTSVMNMAHWAQAVRQPNASAMLAYDFGTQCEWRLLHIRRPCNQFAYGSLVPPAYRLASITTPLALFTGGQDRLADPPDAALLMQALPPHVVVHVHNEPRYEHLDFIWGRNARARVYGRVLALLRRRLPATPRGGGAATPGAATVR